MTTRSPPQTGERIKRFASSVGTRLVLQSLWLRICRGLLAGIVLGFIYLLIGKLAGLPRTPWSFLAIAFPVISALVGAAVLRKKRISEYQAVKLSDDRLGFKDQLAGAYHFILNNRRDPLELMTVEQAGAKLEQRGLSSRAAPFHMPIVFWIFLLLTGICVFAHRGWFPPPIKEELSSATRRELARGKESLEGLLLLQAEFTAEEAGKEFERIKNLIGELNMMSADATKEEILARLSREIENLDTEEDKGDALEKSLEALKKYRSRIALGDLMDQVQEELDKGQEELSVVTEDGKTVSAEVIETKALVDKTAMAENLQKQKELTQDLKDIAREQAKKDAVKPAAWVVGEESKDKTETESEETEDDPQKQLVTRKKLAGYDDLSKLVENRNIREMILSAAGDKTHTTDFYHEVYSNYKRILELVLYKERVPDGQQLYVRRYFDVIEPKEQAAKNGNKTDPGVNQQK